MLHIWCKPMTLYPERRYKDWIKRKTGPGQLKPATGAISGGWASIRPKLLPNEFAASVPIGVSESSSNTEPDDRSPFRQQQSRIGDVRISVRVISEDQPERNVDHRHLNAEFH